MEPSNTLQSKDVERKCQVDGCTEVTVGGRATLCRKHRNNKYKQNYKKKKRKAAGIEVSWMFYSAEWDCSVHIEYGIYLSALGYF